MMPFGGMGGGSGSGGRIFRTASRAALTKTTGVTQSTSSNSHSPNSTTTTTASTSRSAQKAGTVSLSSPTSNCSYGTPVPANSGVPNWPSSPPFDDFDWVSVDGSEDVEKGHGFLDDFVLGPVPSSDEVHNAVSALQQVFTPTHHPQFIRDKFGYECLDKNVVDSITSAGAVCQVSSIGSESDWMEPSVYSSQMWQQSQGCERVYDAFQLLKNESSVQRMVTSLSSDRAVWDAVMNNEVVRELRESFYAADDQSSQSPSENSDDNNMAKKIVRWIFQNTVGKLMEVIDSITKLLDHMLQPQGSEKVKAEGEKVKAEGGNLFEERLRTSFMLSVVVLLVVVVTRSHKA